jgi:glucose-6-phosphate 1-dehydrogenase
LIFQCNIDNTIFMAQTKKAPIIKPFNAVIFGGDGDLAVRKIYPALFHRFVDKQLNVDFNIYAITRSDDKHAAFNERLRKFITESTDYAVDQKTVETFLKKIIVLTLPGQR